jgi:hypothetical protein
VQILGELANPGWITAIAALITAIAALITAIRHVPGRQSAKASRVRHTCRRRRLR